MGKWIIDRDHSIVGFEVAHMMVSKVRGQFDSFTANVEAEDLIDLTTAKISFTFDAASINTRNQTRDNHLKSADFFDIRKYPEITFQSTEITRQKGDGRYKVAGNLALKGITKPVTFDVTFGGKATDPRGGVVFGYEAQATINREEFGLLWNAALESGGILVGKEVTIKVELELMDAKYEFKGVPNLNKASLNNHLAEDKTEHEFQQMIVDNLTDLITVINKDGRMKYTTASLENVLSEEFLAQNSNLFDIIHPKEKDIIRNEVLNLSNRVLKKELKSEFRLFHKDGYYMDVEATLNSMKNKHDEELLLVVMRDIIERKAAEKAIYHMAFHDTLTKLPNRRSFMNQLRNEVLDRKYTKNRLAVLFVDLDDFKSINDTWGHDVGDLVLKETAKRIRTSIRPTDMTARYGGDEFVVMLRDVQDKEDAVAIAKNILAVFQSPIKESNQAFDLTPSIGLAYYPEHGESADDLIKNADTALYYVKERGKNDFSIFNEMIEHQSLERRILENALRQGIKEQQFYMEYQPKVNITTNEIIGMEALVRWKHPELGIISPGKFIPLAEETGLIVPLGEWILRESSRQAALWQSMDYPPLGLSVNISVRQMEDPNFVHMVEAILEETGLEPKRLELEITESVLANVKSTIAILKEIRDLGVLISVDDFGTGYSSLSYIKDLPIDTIKIDQSFVKDIHTNKDSKEIMKALVNMANSIGLNAIAEGIELKEHVKELSEDGYILGQGYYYSKPLKPDAFEEFMNSVLESNL